MGMPQEDVIHTINTAKAEQTTDTTAPDPTRLFDVTNSMGEVPPAAAPVATDTTEKVG